METLRFDVVVVGAGLSGLRFARLVAEKGFNVAIIERKSRNRIGMKTCGDAIGKHHFDRLGITYPKGEELELAVDGIKIYSPDENVIWRVPGEGFEVNRYAFGQRFLREAERYGAIVFSEVIALNPIVEKGYVIGVQARKVDGGKVVFKSRILIDASGVSAVIRTKLPNTWPVSEPLRYEDASIAYREIRTVRDEIDDYSYIRIYLSQKISPGGYWWFFPKGPYKVNVGLGVWGVKGLPNPKQQFYKYIATREELRRSRVLDAGGGIVPTRRPLNVMVAPGFMTFGDAGLTVNPVHGGGMGPSLIAATKAAEIAIEALERDDVSLKGLWGFTRSYNLAYGAKQAALDIMRMFLQHLNDEDLNFIMHKNLITEHDLSYTSSEGDLKLSVVEKALRIIRGLTRPTLLSKLKMLSEYMNKARVLYMEYPEKPEDYNLWASKVKLLYDKFKFEIQKT